MTYTCTREGAMEIHTIKIHQVDLVAAAGRINKELYSKCRVSPSMSDHCLALALIVKAVEDERGESGRPVADDQETETEATEHGTDMLPNGE